ncbi:hypothetical protein TWF694_004095 [Orbilia ellipsospora]|uniref:Uncharacterized protein n=1 Tax=Orbilia ellipsospora TaxID=2528407 RepID=A0AAV9WX28_9PEZI
MVSYKSVSAVILSAAVASAQNGTYPYMPEATPCDITYTTAIPSLCSTGLVDVPYTIKQHCEYGPCEQPEKPYGWEVKTKYCEYGCGPKPTYVPVTECPWESPAPTPACYGAGCHHDEIVCPEGTTYTHYYTPPVQPTYTPAPPPPSTPCPTPTPPPVVVPPPPATTPCPETLATQVIPPPVIPCNTTVPPPPMYTGAAVKTTASGLFGFLAVAIVAVAL